MLADGLLRCAFLVLPAMFGMLILAEPIMALVFGHGQVTEELTSMRAAALLYAGAGLLSFALVKVAVAGFYAVKETRTPVIIASASMLLNVALNMALVRPLGFRGLALATTIAFTVNLLLLLVFFRRRFGPMFGSEFLRRAWKIVVATLAMIACVWGALKGAQALAPGDTLVGEFAQTLTPIAVGVIAYAAASQLLHVEEFATFRSLLKRR